MPRPDTTKYTLLGQTIRTAHGLRSRLSSALILIVAAGFIIVAGGSFWAGEHYASIAGRSKTDSNILLNNIHYKFKYNRTFSENSHQADQAWKDFFPPENGYFTHPLVAPNRSTLSVYHTLHCLNGIRMAYWKMHAYAISNESISESELPEMISPPHIRHCIDLIRQSLMCNPDTTVEVKNETTGGVNGFGIEHQCKDWNQLVDWTIKTQIEYPYHPHGHHSHSDSRSP